MNQFLNEVTLWGGIVLGSIGTFLSVIGLISNRSIRRKTNRIESDRLLTKVWDILAGHPGSTWIFEQKNEAERLEKARRLIDEALLLDRRYPKAHMYLGVYWQFLGEYKKALMCHKRAIELDNTYASAYNNLGRTYGQLGEWEKELYNYRLALKYDSDLTYARYNLGEALFRKGDIDNAISELERVASCRCCPGKVLMRLGDAYLAAGREQEAKIQYQSAVTLNPEDDEVKSRLENLITDAHSSP